MRSAVAASAGAGGRLLIEWLIVALISLGAVWGLTRTSIADRADYAIYDALMATQSRPASNEIFIIAIDEESLGTIGRWPWPRSTHARLLEWLAKVQPAAIGYDVLFVEPSPDDLAVAQAAKAAAPVILPIAFDVPGNNGAPFTAELPTPVIRAVTTPAHATLYPDADGIVRRVGLIAGGGTQTWPHIAELLYRRVRGHASPIFANAATDALPADAFSVAGQVLLPFTGPAGSYRTVPFSSVLNGEVPREMLRGKIVLVGSTAHGQLDQYATPLGTMSGVEMLANATDDLLANRTIRQASPRAYLAFGLLPLIILLIALLLFSPALNLVLGLLLIAATLGGSATLLIWARIWFPPTAALAGLFFVYPLWAWRRLEAASAYMTRELRQLGSEADPLPGRGSAESRTQFLREAIDRQTVMLHSAIERVRDLRRFFGDSIQGLPDATLILDGEGRTLLANRAAERLFVPLLDEPALAAEQKLDDLIRHLAPTATAATFDQSDDREIVSADGRVFVVRVVPLVDATGAPVGSIARLTDISAIRLATRQREDALQLLTHDMRSPQASILALLDRNEDIETLRARIAGYAQRTLELADNFVHLARAQAARPKQDLLDLSALLIDAVDDQWVLAQKSKIRIETKGEDDEHLVLGDRSLLSRALVNLIGNAIKYSDRSTTICCTISESDDVVCCRIIDQGRGIPADELDHLFDPFTRVEARGRRDVGGAGLGLSFVRTVIAQHHGTIHCESEEGKGSTFILCLPRAEDPDA
ncbi:CHASE2 domain-containing sensor protein/signal transduction histidine kinase [Sphingomonas vulcanisoli]|uniref:histidine kinase n=1 Tax=Sphingomonas vulcanisoli TaxID=1658060 RepID=A0ABX0TSU3_9SPHN|nr:CHASE2 domain-containing protein [Sphingomonas vulcanisoli]NIJ06865.1 CHASE2 domain-containing sensor protein/signal transduction histidine kinase [Sphingomonas vulcanisoli]